VKWVSVNDRLPEPTQSDQKKFLGWKMKNKRIVDSCLNCRHCQILDHWDYHEYNCLHNAEPRPYKSEEYTEA